jgi:hypothetical protein
VAVAIPAARAVSAGGIDVAEAKRLLERLQAIDGSLEVASQSSSASYLVRSVSQRIPSFAYIA